MDASRSASGRKLRYDGTLEWDSAVEVPVEVPLNLIYGNIPYAVMMTTPADLEDFVLGFSFTEGVIASPGEIRGIRIEEQPDGFTATVDLAPEALRRHLARRRNLSGRTSCGVCGVESLDQLKTTSRGVEGDAIDTAAIGRALKSLESQQPLHARTHAVHAAALCDAMGNILLVREDVGRHNALDKMIGAALNGGLSPEHGFVIITSRCSFEMIEKAAIFGTATLVAISAPTSFAIDRAKALGVRLLAVARHDAAVAFTDLPQTNPKALAS